MREFLVKTPGQFSSARPFNQLVLAYRDGAPARLSDVEGAGRRENGRTAARFVKEPSVDLGRGEAVGHRHEGGSQVMDDMLMQTLREQMVTLRDEIRERRRSANRSWLALSEPESELEETASKNLLSRALEQIEERARSQERLIDDALAKMEQDEYGECEECGRPISLKRLKLVPWARHCIRCAGSLELARAVRPSTGAVSASMAGGGESGGPLDEEMCEIVVSELRDDGRVELDDLEIHCEDGVVYLEGALPGEQSRETLRQVVSDTLGYDRVVDNIRIDRQAWENLKRAPGRSKARRPEKEVLMEGEDEDVDAFTSMTTGKPMPPPDRMAPERKKRD